MIVYLGSKAAVVSISTDRLLVVSYYPFEPLILMILTFSDRKYFILMNKTDIVVLLSKNKMSSIAA